MLSKSVVGKTIHLVYEGCKKKLSKKQKEYNLVVFVKNFPTKSKCKQVNIVKETTKLKLYKEDSGDIYITNFDEQQELLNFPVYEIYVNNEHFEIQFLNVKLCGQLSQQRNITEEFFLDIESPEVAPQKKRKSIVLDESLLSNESFEDVEINNDDECAESSDDYSYSPLLPTSSTSLEMPPKMIPTNQLVSDLKIEDDDKVVQEFIECAKDHGSLPEADAVTVYKRDENYHVLSGRRRVVAQQQLGNGMMAVNIVKSVEAKQFEMRKFFREHVVKDPVINETVDRFSDIFEYLDITRETLRNLPEKDVQQIFGKHIGEHTKLSILLKVSIFEELSDIIKVISSEEGTMPIRLLTSILQKYKMNRVGTMNFLRSILDTPYEEMSVRKGLDKIEASVHSMLSKKILDSTVVDRFIALYENDSMLETFARTSSIRKRSSGQRFETICRQFEKFKAETQLESKKSTQIISIGTSSLACQLLITEKPNLITQWCQNGTYEGDRIGLLFGTVEQTASCSVLLILPDNLSPRGNHGCLCSVVSVSIFIFRNKRLVIDSEVASVFAESTLPFRSHYSVAELVKLIGSPSDSFYDDGLVLREGCFCYILTLRYFLFLQGLAAELVKNSSIIQVNNSEMKTKISNLLMA
ncbi:hypothetical protein CAEBREN_21879 [Caenorhabditis brenneri]|uniref:ParB/Sulfiredoxin domain-containing protein n=1 Tax=Caenorhabditis brenneri TaxID=135651 RepID=G0MA92_CAEBE|nr:hypothetical protein CAEBREN_21879 [Caenorhabditis brenneri]